MEYLLLTRHGYPRYDTSTILGVKDTERDYSYVVFTWDAQPQLQLEPVQNNELRMFYFFIVTPS
jgi:hypothetical protein